MIRLLIMGLAAFGAIVLIGRLFTPRAPAFKCASCLHCVKLFNDGVMCGYRDKQVFKNPAQIEMCPDHTKRIRSA